MADTHQLTSAITGAAAARRARLLEGLDQLRLRSGFGQIWSENTLFVIGGVLAPLGVLLIVFAWWGAARTPYLFEQIPYLISGGLIGLALAVVGGLFYFAHWVAELVKEQRHQTEVLVAAIRELGDDDAVLRAIGELNERLATAAKPAARPSRKRSAKQAGTAAGRR